MPYIRSSFLFIGIFALLFNSFINAQASYGNVSTDSNDLGSPDPPGFAVLAVVDDAFTIILRRPPPSNPEIVDSVAVTPQAQPLPTATPGQPMPLALPPPTAAPSPIQPGAVEMPLASGDSRAPAPTPASIGTDGGNEPDCPGCCSIYFQYVNVYYWPVASSNTDCLSIVSSTSLPPIPAGYPIVSPSIYVVFPVISAGNASTQVGNIYRDFVTSYAPGELSTIEGLVGPTKAFDFADLPCPPPAVAAANTHFYNPQANPARAYSPRIDLPRGILEMDPAFRDCVAAVYQGFDPPMALQPAGEVTPAKDKQFGLPHKRAAAHPHIKPRHVDQGQRD